LRQGNLCNCLFFSALSKTHFGQQDNTYTVWKNNVKKASKNRLCVGLHTAVTVVVLAQKTETIVYKRYHI